MSNDDYSSGRNKRRKTYGYERAAPQNIEVVIDNVTRSFDRNTVVIHRDFYLVRDVVSGSVFVPTNVYAEYDEDRVAFNNTTQASKTFNITFSSQPAVTLFEIEPATNDNSQNVQPFIVSHTTTQVTVGLSAPFSGNVIYRAIYSPTWPALVQRNVISSSFFYTAQAGYIDLAAMTDFTASYGSLGSVPSFVFLSTYDVNSNNQADVAFVATGSYTLTAVSGNVSAPITDRIYFMAIA